MYRNLGRVLTLAVLFMTAGQGRADPITYNFQGTITEVSGGLLTDVGPGSVFTGTISYEAGVADEEPSDLIGAYPQTTGGIRVVVDGKYDFELTAPGSEYAVMVLEDTPEAPTDDVFPFVFNEGGQPTAFDEEVLTESISLFLSSELDTDVLESDQLEGLELDLADFEDHSILVVAPHRNEEEGTVFAGEVTFLELASALPGPANETPEPGSLALLVSGVAGVLGWNCFRRRRQPLRAGV